MFGAAQMSAAEHQRTEDQQRRDMEAGGVRPEVFAAMMVCSALNLVHLNTYRDHRCGNY